MTSAEHTPENEELGGDILGIIDAYRMGADVDARDLHREVPTELSAPERLPGGRARVSAQATTPPSP